MKAVLKTVVGWSVVIIFVVLWVLMLIALASHKKTTTHHVSSPERDQYYEDAGDGFGNEPVCEIWC